MIHTARAQPAQAHLRQVPQVKSGLIIAGPQSHLQTLEPPLDWQLTADVCMSGQLADDEDTLWTVDQRESTAALLARGVAFVQWLMARPESRLAVVTHSSFLFHLMANFGQQAAPPVTVSCPSCADVFIDAYHACLRPTGLQGVCLPSKSMSISLTLD